MREVVALLALLATTAGIGVVALPNVFHVLLCFALVFLALGGVYLTLGAGFLAIVQLLVAVAVTLLILLAVILIPQATGHHNSSNRQRLVAGAATLLTLGLLAGGLIRVNWLVPGLARPISLGWLIFSRYVLPLGMAGLILLVAVIAATIVAKGALRR